MERQRERLTRNLLVRLSPGLFSRLSEHAASRGLSMGGIVRLAIERLLTDEDADQHPDANLPALAGLVAAEHVRHLVESFLPRAEETTLVARSKAIDSALERLDDLTERFGRAR